MTTSDVDFDEHFNNLKTASKNEAIVDITANQDKPTPTTTAKVVNPSSKIIAVAILDNDLFANRTCYTDP